MEAAFVDGPGGGEAGARTIDLDAYEVGLGDSEYPLSLNLIAGNDILVSTRTFLSNGDALPNKLFEFIQAKLAIAVGPSVEMKRVVNQYHLGVVSDDFSAESLASAIKQLDRAAIKQFKHHAVAASAIENAAHYANIYLQQVKAFMN